MADNGNTNRAQLDRGANGAKTEEKGESASGKMVSSLERKQCSMGYDPLSIVPEINRRFAEGQAKGRG